MFMGFLISFLIWLTSFLAVFFSLRAHLREKKRRRETGEHILGGRIHKLFFRLFFVRFQMFIVSFFLLFVTTILAGTLPFLLIFDHFVDKPLFVSDYWLRELALAMPDFIKIIIAGGMLTTTVVLVVYMLLQVQPRWFRYKLFAKGDTWELKSFSNPVHKIDFQKNFEYEILAWIGGSDAELGMDYFTFYLFKQNDKLLIIRVRHVLFADALIKEAELSTLLEEQAANPYVFETDEAQEWLEEEINKKLKLPTAKKVKSKGAGMRWS